MRLSLISVTAPTEPVDLAAAKAAARLDVDETHLDAVVSGFITTAREQAEHLTGRFYRQVVARVELDAWPAADEVLPVADPASVAVSYWSGSAWVVLAGAAFVWAPEGFGLVISPPVGGSWPALGDVAVGARVRVDCTVNRPAPQSVQTFIAAQVAAWVAQPEAVAGKALAVNPLYERLLDAERTFR